MKPRISYAEFAWAAAFARIEEGQKLSARGMTYRVNWKHVDPDWIQLTSHHSRIMVRKGDPLLLELRHAM